MRGGTKNKLIWTIIIIIIINSTQGFVIADSPSDISYIQGVVKDANTNEVISSVNILLDGEYSGNKTGPDGTYNIIADIGSHEITVVKDGYYNNSIIFEITYTSQIVYQDIYLNERNNATLGNSCIFGYVYDKETKQPIFDAEVELDGQGYYNWTYTNEKGYYEMYPPKGKFYSTCYGNDSYYDYKYSTIKLGENEKKRFDWYLDRRLASINEVTYEFSNSSWDYVTVIDKSITYKYSTINHMKGYFDENNDGLVTQAEVDAFELSYETQFETDYLLHSSEDDFMVDNVIFKYVHNSMNWEIKDATGPTNSTDPYISITIMKFKSNTSISTSNTHKFQIFYDYDSVGGTIEYYVKFPSSFEMTSYNKEKNVIIMGSNTVKIDPKGIPRWNGGYLITLNVTKKIRDKNYDNGLLNMGKIGGIDTIIIVFIGIILISSIIIGIMIMKKQKSKPKRPQFFPSQSFNYQQKPPYT